MRHIAILLALFALQISACSRQPAQPKVPDSGWEVMLGGGGGVTGGGGQIIVRADGKMFNEKWSGPSAERKREPIGTANPEAVKALGQAMNDPELVDLDYKHYSNMTTTLTWRHGDQERIYAWELNDPKLPTAIHKAELAFDRAFRSATDSND